jgi:hypothetical protein
MRTACLVLVMAGSAGLTAHAVPSSAPSQHASAHSASKASNDHQRGDEHTAAVEDRAHTGTHSAEQRNHHRSSGKNLASLTKPNRPRHLRIDHKHSTSENANVQQISNKSSAAMGGSIQKEAVKSELLGRSPSFLRPPVPSLNRVRHRGSNPAVVGGFLNSKIKNIGSINGTHMDPRR